MRLSKLGLVFLVLYLLWAGFWYDSYRVCPPYSGSGLMGITLGDACENTLSLVAFPVGWLFVWISPKAMPYTDASRHLSVLVFFFISCAVFYVLGVALALVWRALARLEREARQVHKAEMKSRD